jgi:serine/threonine-protein kinase
MESLVGRMLGKYELTAMIGGGGMATVYKAHHPGLDQEVAVKILHPFLSTDPSFVDRFRREARAVAALRHPNIVRVLDFDHEDHLYYMVMEYIGGPTLSAVLSGRKNAGGLSLPDIGRIFTPLCSAIDYAASRGMVHRDIKPANIIMSEEEEPIVTDYGIAKMIGSTSLTSPGTVVGSAHYMSPEQAQGQDCDVRSDLYSLGIVLFECLAGVVPFEGDTTVTVLVKHISAPVPSIRALRPNLPPAIEPMLARALAKQPQDRYEMGVSFAEDLQSALAPGRSTLAATEVVASAAVLSETVLSETPPPATTPPTVETASPATTSPTVETAPPQDTAPTTAAPEPSGPETAVAASEAALSASVPAMTAPEAAMTTPPVETAAPPPPAPDLDATTFEQPVIEQDVADSSTVEQQAVGEEAAELAAAESTRLEALPVVEAASILAVAHGASPPSPPAADEVTPPAPPPPPDAAGAETFAASPEATPSGKVGQSPPETPAEARPEAAGAVGAGQGAPPRRRNRTRLIIVAAAAVVLIGAIGAGTTLALQGGSAETTTTLPVTTTGTTLLSTTTSSLTTSTTMRLTTTTTRLTTTTVRATTSTAKPTTTTAKPTTTVKRTTTTKKPTTTQTTSPPDTIGPGTTSPPDTIGPG